MGDKITTLEQLQKTLDYVDSDWKDNIISEANYNSVDDSVLYDYILENPRSEYTPSMQQYLKDNNKPFPVRQLTDSSGNYHQLYVDAQGRPVRETISTDGVTEKVIYNKDGSIDTLTYKADGSIISDEKTESHEVTDNKDQVQETLKHDQEQGMRKTKQINEQRKKEEVLESEMNLAKKDFRDAGYGFDDVEEIVPLDKGMVLVKIGDFYYDVNDKIDRDIFINQLHINRTDEYLDKNSDILSEQIDETVDKNNKLYFDKDEVVNVANGISNIINNVAVAARRFVSAISTEAYMVLLPETKKNASDLPGMMEKIQSQINQYANDLKPVYDNLHSALVKAGVIDESKNLYELGIYGNTGSTKPGNSHGGSSGSTDTGTVTETPVETPLTIENQILVQAALGLITFTEIVPMYSTLGSETTENSVTTTTYGLLGIEKYNNQNYYKIVDKTTGKVYYVEINDKVKYEGEMPEVLEVKNPTIRYDTTQLDNENNNAKLINDGIYLVTGRENVEDSGITFEFAKILDSTDGKNYYFQVGEKVEINSLENYMKGNA